MKTLLIALLAALAGAAHAADKPAAGKTVVLAGADLYTVSHGVIPRGELLIEGGKIAAVGAKVDAPAGAERIDLSGKRIYPGYVAANSNMGLTEVDAVRATVDQAEVGPINPNARSIVAIDADSELFPVARANGVLSVLVVPQAGEDGLITGQSALVKLDGWTWEEMRLADPVGVHLSWPSTRLPPWLPREMQEKAGEAARKKLGEIDQAFRDARAYRAAKGAGKKDLRWEAMIPVLDGKTPLFVHASNAVQIREALEFAKREQLRIVLVGGVDAWRFADTLKARDVPVILGSSHNLPLRRWEAYDTIYANAGKLAKAGVRFAIANDAGGSSNERNLPYQAASYAAYGLGAENALRAITLSPAEILGVADRLGSLDAGKDATLFVANGDALEDATQVERAWIQGREVSMANKHTRLYEKYQRKYEGKPRD